MHPGEERLRARFLEPFERGVDDLICRTPYSGEIEPLVLPEFEGIVVVLKTLGESPASVEDEGADERSCSVAFCGEPLSEGDIAVGERRLAVDAHAVRRRIKAGHDRGVRRQRVRRRRDAPLEESAVARER